MHNQQLSRRFVVIDLGSYVSQVFIVCHHDFFPIQTLYFLFVVLPCTYDVRTIIALSVFMCALLYCTSTCLHAINIIGTLSLREFCALIIYASSHFMGAFGCLHRIVYTQSSSLVQYPSASPAPSLSSLRCLIHF